MNREIEERIVAMYFDNEDFEKNAKQTIKTLDQLKEGMNLEESAKGFDVFDKIGKKLNLDKFNTSAQKLKGTMNSIGNMAKNMLHIGDGPLHALENVLNSFRGYLTKFIGFDLASKIVSSVEGAMRGLVIQPVMAGWNQYEGKMDSVKTIMSSTGESMEVVEDHLQLMTEYANQTIYSLSDMTSNLGKFTNNGVKLKDATKAMIGVANATADAGQGSQQASMAFYNVSQAMGVGKMTSIDWKSLENANIATTKLKNTFIEMAAANGQLKKEIGPDGIAHYFFTKDSRGNEIKDKAKWMEVTAQNFRDTLSKGWLDRETMLRTFMIYSGEDIDPDTLKSWGITDPAEIERLINIGKEARAAATEVRTFSKMMDALREAAQSGWADTFELIFGNMEEGTQLWGRLSGFFENILSSSAEARNGILKNWKTTREVLGSKANKKNNKGFLSDSEENWDPVEVIYGRNGREILIDALFDLLDVVKEISSSISEAFHSIFGSMDGRKLFELTQNFEKFTKSIKAWIGTTEDSTSRISKFKKALEGIFSVVKVVINFLKIGFNLVKRLFTPVADLFLNFFEVFGNFFTGVGDLGPVEVFQKLGEGFGKTWEKIKGFFSPKDIYDSKGFKIGQEAPVITWLKNTWQNAKNLIRGWAFDNGFGEWLTSVWTGIQSVWTNFTTWLDNSGVGEFFSNTWQWICGAAKDTLQFFTVADEQTGETGFIKFLNSVSSSLESAWNTIVEFFRTGDGKGIAQFLSNTWQWVVSQFSTDGTVEYGYMDGKLQSWYKKSPAESFLNDIWQGIQDAWKAITTWGFWTDIATFLSNTWGWITSLFTPKKQYDDRGFELNESISPVESFLGSIWHGIQTAWNSITTWGFWSDVSTFLNNTWAWITSAFTPKKQYDDRGFELNESVSPVESFLGSILEGIKTAWTSIVGWDFWGQVGEFLGNTWGWISSRFSSSGVEHGYVDGRLQSWYKKAPVEEFLETIWNGIKDTWDKIVGWEGWPAIAKFAGDTWNWIIGLINSDVSSTSGSETAPVQEAMSEAKSVTDEVNQGMEDIVVDESTPEKLSIIQTIFTAVGEFFGKIKEVFGGVSDALGLTTYTDAFGKLMAGLGELIKAVAVFIGSTATSLAHALSGGFDWSKDLWPLLKLVFITAIPTIIRLMSLRWQSKLAEVAGSSQSIGLQFLEIAGGILLIAEAINLLGNMELGKLAIGGAAILVIGVIVGSIIALIGSLKDSETKLQEATATPVTGWERIGSKLISWVGIVAVVKIISDQVLPIIDALKETDGKVKGADVLDTLLGITALVSSMMIIASVISKMKVTVQGAGGMGMTIIVLGLAIYALMQGIMAFAQITLTSTPDQIREVGEKLAALAEIFGMFFAGFGAGRDKEITTAGYETLSEIADQFDDEKLDKIKNLVGIFKDITDTLNIGTIGDNLIGDQFLDTMGWQHFQENAELFGQGMRSLLATAISLQSDFDETGKLISGTSGYDKNFERLNGMIDIAKKITGMMNDMNNVIKTMSSGDYKHLLGDYYDYDPFDVYKQVLQKLLDAFGAGVEGRLETGEIKFNATPVIDAIVVAMGLGETAIATAVHDMVQNGLNALGETDNGTPFEIPQVGLFNGMDLSGLFGGNVDLSSLVNQFVQKDSSGNITSFFNMDLGQLQTDFASSMTTLEAIIPDLNALLAGKGWGTWTNENGEEINPLSEMQSQMQTLITTMEEYGALTVTITPVFDFKNLTQEALQNQLDQMPLVYKGSVNNPGTTRMDLSSLSGLVDLDAIKTKLDSIVSAILVSDVNNVAAVNRAGNQINGVANEIGRMQLVLDTGVLVGQITPMIDVELYKRSRRADRTGTTYSNTPVTLPR